MKLLKMTLFLCLALSIVADDKQKTIISGAIKTTNLTSEQLSDLKRRSDSSPKFDIRCDDKFLKSFNLFGRGSSASNSLVFCPTVVSSCCTLADQIAIYDNWITSRELETLNNKFASFTTMIESFLEVAQEITNGAGTIIENMEDKSNNECKIAARRILSYQVDDLKEALLDMSRVAFDFMRQTYKGFYCGICDANNHDFISRETKTIKVTEKFCRSIISNTLTSLVYYKIHFPIYINLISSFAATCDIQGKFVQATLEQGIIVQSDKNDVKVINQCFNTRNDPIWLNNCQEICQKWNPGQIVEYFLPNLNQLAKATNHLQNVVDKFEPDARAKRRVLKETGNKRTKKLNKKNIKTAKKTRKLDQPASPNYLIAEYLNGTLPYYTDDRGYPLNRTDFTNFGSNLTAQQYVDYIESLYDAKRRPIKIDPESMIVFVSQNTSISASLREFTIEVQKNGTDFYRDGQFSRFELDLIENIASTGRTKNTKKARKLHLAKSYSKIIKKAKKMKEPRKKKREEKRKLKSSWIGKSLAFVFVILFSKY